MYMILCMLYFSSQLCSRNADGETPFMTSICSQNYAAALRILDYLEEWSASHNHNQQLQSQWRLMVKFSIQIHENL